MIPILKLLLLAGLSSTSATAAQETDLNLEFSISKTINVKPRDNISYSLVVRHHQKSTTDADDVRLYWYYPSYLSFSGTYLFQGSTIIHKNDFVTFKMGKLPLGSSKTVRFQAMFDGNNTLSTGIHQSVSPVQLLYKPKEGRQDEDLQKFVLIQFQAIVSGCEKPLGLNDKDIVKDVQITASSAIPNNRPENVRRDESGWCANDGDKEIYVQVQFESKVRITRLQAFGRIDKDQWTNSFSVEFIDPNKKWRFYSTNGFKKIFPGNINNSVVVSHYLQYPIETYGIRVYPLSWNKRPCIRLEFYGCYVSNTKDNCLQPLGIESGLVADDALSDSIQDTSNGLANPANARLNKKVTSFPYGWYLPPVYQTGYLQVDFGQAMKIFRLAIQGGYSQNLYSGYYVKSFYLKYSNTSLDWKFYGDQSKPTLLHGPSDRYAAKYTTFVQFQHAVVGRYIRIIPDKYHVLRVMRFEVYGCLAVDKPSVTDADNFFSRRSLLHDGKRLIVCQFTKNQDSSSCFTTDNGNTWEKFGSGIINIFAFNKINRLLYGLDNRFQYIRSTDDGKSWALISEQQWHRESRGSKLQYHMGIPDYITNEIPTPNQTLTTSESPMWGGSATGVYKKETVGSPWKLVARWMCCGS